MQSSYNCMKDERDEASATKRFKQRAVAMVWTVAFVVLALLLIWTVSNLILLVFSGILISIFLRSLGDGLARVSRLNPRICLILVILFLLLALILLGGWFAADVAEQVGELSKTLPAALKQLHQQVQQSELGGRVLSLGESMNLTSPPKDGILTKASDFLSTTFGVIGSSVVVLLVGFYLAFNPHLYLKGFLLLIPQKKQGRIDKVIDEAGKTLRWWLIGKVISMVAIGVMTILGLSILGVPLALGLGTLAGLFSFIPNIGPLLSAAPAILLAFAQSPILAVYVTLLYVGIQAVEGNILTPYIEKKTVSLPPALTIVTQVLFGILFGFLGLLLAAPLTAAGVVIVKMLYVEDILGQSARLELKDVDK